MSETSPDKVQAADDSAGIARLRALMAALRTPGTGCPWDLEQDFASIAPFTVEEAYEVADAIARGDLDDLKDELGDLLLQVVFHARLAEEAGAFAFSDVVEAICAKLIRRHPHVFGDARSLSPAAVKRLWDDIKAQERRAKAARAPAVAHAPPSLLAGVPLGMPALTRAVKLQAKAARVGFDWPEPRFVLAKLREEIDEIEEALTAGDTKAAAGELGDLLFAAANLARHLDADPEAVGRATNAKFERRFRFIEQALAAEGRAPAQSSLAEMDALWDAAKRQETKPK
jgi:ATP diphosphatase